MTEVTYCEKHPDRETGLRCNRCNKLICSACAKRTPTGYTCEDCLSAQGKKFDTAVSQDYILAAATAGALALVGAIIANFLGWFILFLAPVIANVIVRAVSAVTEKRRSKQLNQVVLAATVVGGSLPTLVSLFFFGFYSLLAFLWPSVYVAFVAYTVYMSMTGIRIRR